MSHVCLSGKLLFRICTVAELVSQGMVSMGASGTFLIAQNQDEALREVSLKDKARGGSIKESEGIWVPPGKIALVMAVPDATESEVATTLQLPIYNTTVIKSMAADVRLQVRQFIEAGTERNKSASKTWQAIDELMVNWVKQWA